MAIGVYLTYRILDVADLTVDGSFGTGGAVCVVLVLNGVPVGAALVAARPHDSGRVKWARGSGRSHRTTAPAARDLGTSISRWLALPRNRAA